MVEKNGHRFIMQNTSNILLTCEHASDHIPHEYDGLGVVQEDLCCSKDLYDPGAREMTQFLSEQLSASALYADVSRLVIDYNRRCNAMTKHNNTYHSCPLKTELLIEKDGCENMICIPRNTFDDHCDFDNEERVRYERYVLPYVSSAYDVLDVLRKEHKKTYIVQVHSFFPTYNGAKRDVDICVLYDQAEDAANKVIQNLQSQTTLRVAGNDPWSMKDTDGVVFERVYEMDDVEVIAFDVNNKHLTTKDGINKISQLLLDAIRSELTA
jgi:predicted N-formylglutamate amidohydrolase